jgi:hypothetical protein
MHRPNFFYFRRRQRDSFQWLLFFTYDVLNTEDYWIIQMIPQWKHNTHETFLITLFEEDFMDFGDVPFSPSSNGRMIRCRLVEHFDFDKRLFYFILQAEYHFHRENDVSLPTRQHCLDILTEHIQTLAKQVEVKVKRQRGIST